LITNTNSARFTHIITVKLPPRIGLSTSVANGKLYAIGGFGGLTLVQKYNPETDTRETLADMPFEGFAISASAVDGKVYIIGGSEKAYPFRPLHLSTV